MFELMRIYLYRFYLEVRYGGIDMARIKQPEQTLETILQIATKLFLEQGFEKTSMQHIIDEIGMSKGAIYHHFKSKEEILSVVMERQFNKTTQYMEQLIAQAAQLGGEHGYNARDRLVYILDHLLANEEVHSYNHIFSTQIKNPQFVVTGIQRGIKVDAPVIAAIIAQGEQDGSLNTDYPLQCAEIFLLLVNIWINPMLFERSQADTYQRLKFLQHMMQSLGVDIVTNTLIQKIVDRHVEIGGYE